MMDTLPIVWQRKGSCVIFDQKRPRPVYFRRRGDSLRLALSWSKGLRPTTRPGPNLLYLGMETVIETMEPQEKEDFLCRRLRPLRFRLQTAGPFAVCCSV
jgi:hypothetical protein